MATHTFFCVDGHTCGNPVRLVAGGGPRLEGANMVEKRAHFLREFDWIRTGLMFEPRGHDMMSGAILYPPTRPDCDIAFLFIETSGCLPMCGHGTIGTVTMALEEKIAPEWHTYWKNPGDSGEPMRVEWTLPRGFEAKSLKWPVPEKIMDGKAVVENKFTYAGFRTLGKN